MYMHASFISFVFNFILCINLMNMYLHISSINVIMQSKQCNGKCLRLNIALLGTYEYSHKIMYEGNKSIVICRYFTLMKVLITVIFKNVDAVHYRSTCIQQLIGKFHYSDLFFLVYIPKSKLL
jgi:hypothetical protein